MSHEYSREISRAMVREQIAEVTDPELDRSIVELDYVDRIDLDPPQVHVEFTLPTAWCSPAFAWMMAVDIREYVEELDGIDRCTIDLQDHMHSPEITEGVNGDDSFEETFEDEATDDIESIRRKLDEKALLARQYAVVEALYDVGANDEQIRTLTRSACTVHDDAGYIAVDLDGLSVCIDTEKFSRYIEKAEDLGVVTGDDEPLFRNPDHEPIEAGNVELVHARTRSAGVNQTGQGGLCDALHDARYGDARPEEEKYSWESPTGADD